MELLSVIRRWYHRDGQSIREIARKTGLSRNTIRKYLASKVIEPKYSTCSKPNKLDDYSETLTKWLDLESKRTRKKRRSVKQLFFNLIPLGYTGSYDRVAAFARNWREQQRNKASAKGTFVPLYFAAGEAFQFDWSEDWVRINGKSTKLQIAHFKLCHSRAMFLRAYFTQTHEMLFDAHNHAFEYFEGIPDRGIYDNMKTAVDKVGKGKVRVVNRRFQAMVSHFMFDADYCNPAAGWEKGQVEKNVQDMRHRIWHEAPDFSSLEELNAWLETRCKEIRLHSQHPEYKDRTVYEVWEEEKCALMPVVKPFDGYTQCNKPVSATCLINFERNRYSVPARYANRPISLRVYASRLVVVAETEVVAEHKRVFTRDHCSQGMTIYNWQHYLAVLQRKPGALRNGAPFLGLPESYRKLQKQLLKHPGGDREMVDILALVLHYDESLIEKAIAHALESGTTSKQHVLNCLNRLLDIPRPKPSQTPAKLTLVTEPKADLGRYDNLRENKDVC